MNTPFLNETTLINKILSYIPIKYPAYAVILLILILFIYRLARAAVGEKFSDTRLFFTPVLYSMFVLVTFIGSPRIEIYLSFVIAILGIALGILFSRKVRIFSKNGNMYYRRSIAVAFFWTMFFSAKILVLLYYPKLDFVVIFSVLLTLTTGMLLGEASVIYHRHSKYRIEDSA
jgi:hypothetical protein